MPATAAATNHHPRAADVDKLILFYLCVSEGFSGLYCEDYVGNDSIVRRLFFVSNICFVFSFVCYFLHLTQRKFILIYVSMEPFGSNCEKK